MSDPKCEYFKQCGGCSTQHIDYELQLQNKKQNVANYLNISEKNIEIFSDEPYNYRNRMDFIFQPKGLGFREKGKWWKIVDIEKCEISTQKLNDLLQEIRSEFPKEITTFDVKQKIGTLRYATIRTPTEDSSVTFILVAVNGYHYLHYPVLFQPLPYLP